MGFESLGVTLWWGPGSNFGSLLFLLRIGNGVGKQGYGNRPPIDDRNPIRKFSIDPLCLQKQGRNSKRKADTEIQYRPRIVDTDIDCGPRFCGPRFRDS